MGWKTEKIRRVSRRYTTGSTRRRRSLPRPGAWRPVFLICLLAVLVVSAALIWGSTLKKQSDAYRAGAEANAWTLDESQDAWPAVTVSDHFRGMSLRPGESTDKLSASSQYNGAVLTLSATDEGVLAYDLSQVSVPDITIQSGAEALDTVVSRLHKMGLTVSGVFRIRSLDTAFTSDPALMAVRRGVELSLLVSCAQAGVDDILLLGLPYGDDSSDARTLDFLREVKALMGYTGHQPAIGVALAPDGFAQRGEELNDGEDNGRSDTDTVYAGRLTPGRMLTVCDYLAIDLRDVPAEHAEEFLYDIQYAYVRYALRLLIADPAVVAEADRHGMARIEEWYE